MNSEERSNEAAVQLIAAHDANPPLGPWDRCDGCHVDYVRSLLARIAAVEAERDAALDRIVAVRAWRTRWGTRGPIDMWMEFDDSLAALAASPTPTGPETEQQALEADAMLEPSPSAMLAGIHTTRRRARGPATPEPTEETR